MAVSCKGLQHITTISGAVGTCSHSVGRHVHYFKIGCLEIERARRIKERRSSAKRNMENDTRLQEIEKEIHQRHEFIGSTGSEKDGPEQATRQMKGFPNRSNRKTIRY